MKVVTTKGTLVRDSIVGGQDRTSSPLSETDAKALAAECNKRAEKLGIEARYEVKP